jgi:Zn-dependent peptidase ImmA (M78 family)/transcriptional regulator with XRE-family HTH domain
MNSSVKEQIPFNPLMLRWAREWRGISIEEAAKKVGKKPEDIFAWENSNKNPTVKQARSLSDLYGRPFLEFFLPEPPDIYIPKSVPDFRAHRGITSPAENRLVLDIHRWAETQRINAIDLFAEVGESPSEVPKQILSTIATSPDEAANNARAAVGFTFQDQVQLQQNELTKLPEILRRKFEAIGILTLKRSDMQSVGVRGMCIAKFPLPVIAFTKESPAAQAYTLAHEFAHVLIRKSGITGQKNAEYAAQPIEKWCDRFAASFLRPRTEIENICGEKPNSPQAVIEDSELQRFADLFKVSRHALLIRLVHLGYVRASYYWDIKKPQFDEEESKFKAFGRAKYYGTRYKSSLGV